MADKQPAEGTGARLMTLSEVSTRTGISLPTLQRYKKQHQARIPSVGKGRRQRYPEEALPVFREIRDENLQRRGRPPKSAGAGRKIGGRRRTPPPKKARTKAAGAAAGTAAGDQLLTLTEVSKRAKISYPTAVRYVKAHASEIPYEGSGRKRRFHPEAVNVMKRLRKESRRGGGAKVARKAASSRGRRRVAAPAAAGGDVEKRLRALEASHERLSKKFNSLMERLRKPRRVI